jgi:hypothetical protein
MLRVETETGWPLPSLTELRIAWGLESLDLELSQRHLRLRLSTDGILIAA